jgi:HEAT repeat protein
MKHLWLAFLVVAPGAGWAKSVAAPVAAKPAAPSEPVSALKAALMTTSDEEKAVDAAKKLGESADPKAVDVLLDALALGAPPTHAAPILTALGARKDPRAIDVLKHFAKNRNPELRKKALMALGAIPDAKVVTPLIDALSDNVEEVRAAAAKALGDRKEKSAEARLISLLRHRDAAAATALAQLGTPDLAHRIAEMLGDIPDALFCTAIGDMLKRPDFGPENIRGELVKALAKVPGIDSTTALLEYVAATEKDKARPSRQEAQKIVDQRSSQ